MLPPNNKTHAQKSILGTQPTTKQEIAFSVEKQVNASTPSTFLVQALDDPISPVDNSYLMDNALKSANIPVEMHIFQSGGHGWGLGKKGVKFLPGQSFLRTGRRMVVFGKISNFTPKKFPI